MAHSAHEVFGADAWWSRVIVTTATPTAADIKVVPTASAVGANRARRLCLTWYHIVGHNTNAAATTFVIRNKTTTTTIFLGGSMGPTTGSVNLTASGIWIAGAANESIEIVVSGAITGQLDVTCGGRILPAEFPTTRNYTGAP